MVSLPPPDLAGETALRHLYAQVPTVACKGLCQRSCGPIGMSPYEARRFSDATRRQRIPVEMFLMHHDGRSYSTRTVEDHTCPALGDDGTCRVYAMRPLICRLWGVTEGMECPWGCRPDRLLTTDESRTLIEAAMEIGRRDG